MRRDKWWEKRSLRARNWYISAFRTGIRGMGIDILVHPSGARRRGIMPSYQFRLKFLNDRCRFYGGTFIFSSVVSLTLSHIFQQFSLFIRVGKFYPNYGNSINFVGKVHKMHMNSSDDDYK